MKTNQEAFTVMVMHLRKQGDKSLIAPAKSMCAYRGPNGKKCAIGALIEDKFYTNALEHKPVSHDKVEQALDDSGWASINMEFLDAMQLVHDDEPIDVWEHKFEEIAAEYGLELPEA